MSSKHAFGEVVTEVRSNLKVADRGILLAELLYVVQHVDAAVASVVLRHIRLNERHVKVLEFSGLGVLVLGCRAREREYSR